jgi:hypothetical protein
MPPQRGQGNNWTIPTDELLFRALQSRRDLIKEQIESVTDTRDDLTRDLSSRVGADLAGVQARIAAFDARIMQLDADLAKVENEMAANAPASLSVPPPERIYRGFNDGDMFGAGFTGAGIMFALFIPLMVKYFRRRKWSPAGTTTQVPAIGGERIDRMEQAIDSIAVEIERVSENQRFMTRLMTETQLAGTIAAVRGSTEAARVAAEKSSNA